MSRLFRLRTLTTVAAVGSIGAVVYFRDPRASGYRYFVMPAARALLPDVEDSHSAAIQLMRFPALNPRLPSRWLELIDPEGLLRTTLFLSSANSPGDTPIAKRVRPLTLATPIGVSAGLDKDGKAVDTLFQYGFSWVEVGSVTPKPQAGNPRPRAFRLAADKAIVNRFGFNSEGHAAVAARLRVREIEDGGRRGPGQVLAVNLGKNKHGDEIEDYVKGVRQFGTLADALVVNVSSPNTPGLRDLQSGSKLGSLLSCVIAERNALPLAELPPLLVKVAPDLSSDEVKAIAHAVLEARVDGVIVGNTTIGRPASLKSPAAVTRQTGGLSGPPVKPLELQALRELRREVGPELTIIGCGGISTAEDALEFARAGANFVQLYTSFAYDGPEKPSVLAEDLVSQLKGKKWSEIAESPSN